VPTVDALFSLLTLEIAGFSRSCLGGPKKTPDEVAILV